jgi:peptide/nickel transport system permease protein
MAAYLLRRLLATIPVMGVALFVFALLQLSPGDPAAVIAGDYAKPADVQRIRQQLGLDQPLHVQLAIWLRHVIRGDLGTSIFSGLPVARLIGQRLEPTLALTVCTMVIAVLGFSVPVFWLEFLLIYSFAVQLELLPGQGYVSFRQGLGPYLKHLVLPSFTLGMVYMALIARMTRASMLEVLREDYIRTAHAKGLQPHVVLLWHALKNAALRVKILSCVARMHGRYGRVKVVQVLLGSHASDILNSHLSRLSTYGILKGASRSMIDAYLEALIEAECIQIVGDEFLKLDLTPLGQAVMRRQQRVLLALPGLTVPALPKTDAPRPLTRQTSPTASVTVPDIPSLAPEVIYPPPVATRASASAVTLAPAPTTPPEMPQTPHLVCDDALFERLRVQRTVLARAEALPPYCVFNDRTLREMATHCPTTPAGLLRLYGVGAAKASKYGV